MLYGTFFVLLFSIISLLNSVAKPLCRIFQVTFITQ